MRPARLGNNTHPSHGRHHNRALHRLRRNPTQHKGENTMSTSAEKFAEWAQHRVSPPPPPPPEPKRDPVAQAFADAISADRKSTRLNSSHVAISYAVFCLHKTKTS